MNKAYFGIPIVALVAFSLYYVQFSKQDDEAMREKERQAEIAKEKKLEEERQARLEAVRIATEQLKTRREEAARTKAQKEAADAKREEERITLDKSKTEQSQLKVELKDLKEEVDDEKRLLDLALERKRNYETEREFVLSYNDTARKNKDRFLKLVEKIDESEKAKAAAEAASTKK